MPNSTPENARDAEILEHLRRYHLTTPEILHQLFFRGCQRNAVTQVTSRLTAEGRISKPLTLFEQRKYFVLTPREAERLGEHRSIGKKFEYLGLVNAYAVLAYCVSNETNKFTPKEFAAKFPGYVLPGVRSGHYYIDVEELPNGLERHRLGFIHVDFGITPAKLVKKIDRIIARTRTRLEFDEAVRKGMFVIAVLVPSEEKAKEVELALKYENTSTVRLRIEPVPELGELLTRRGRLKDNRKKPRRKPEGPSDGSLGTDA